MLKQVYKMKKKCVSCGDNAKIFYNDEWFCRHCSIGVMYLDFDSYKKYRRSCLKNLMFNIWIRRNKK